MDEIEPSDCRGTIDTLDAVNVDFVNRARKRLVNDFDRIPNELGRHETKITYVNVLQYEVGFDEWQRVFIGRVKVEDVSDSVLDEFGDISRQYPATLVDLGCYLFGFEGHVGARSINICAPSLSFREMILAELSLIMRRRMRTLPEFCFKHRFFVDTRTRSLR